MITGGGGFVGCGLVEGFASMGWEVVAVDTHFDSPSGHPRVRQVRGELESGVLRDESPVDLVIHGAWVTTSPADLGISDSDYQQLNLGPLAVSLGWAAEGGARAFVFLSSSGVFSANDGGRFLSDDDIPTGDSPYARAKRDGEKRVLAESSEKLATHVVRLGYLYGSSEKPRATRPGVSLVGKWISDAREGRPLRVRADNPIRDWTQVPDLPPAVRRVADSPSARRPLHLGAPYPLHDREVAELIAAEFPGAVLEEGPEGPPVKPPMRPSDVPEVRDSTWAHPRQGIASSVRLEAVA